MRSFILTLAIVLPIAGIVTVAACSSNDSSGGGSCKTTADCSGGEQCGYAINGACSAAGSCMQPAGNLPFTACGCDGTEVSYVAPGYASAPVTSGTACKDAAPPEDSGSNEDAGQDAATDAPTDGPTTTDGGSEGGSDGGLDGATDGGDSGDAAAD